MRSGNHAVIDWIRNIYPDQKILFLNNVAHGDKNPFLNYEQIEYSDLELESNINDWSHIERDVLIYSYEDKICLLDSKMNLIDSALSKQFDLNRSRYCGESNYFFTVYILRDPFNCLASRLQMLRTRGNLGGLDDMSLIKENWKALARKALKVENGDKLSGELVVNFNKWVSDIDYRLNLAKLLIGSKDREGRNSKISGYGVGSSFGSNPDLKLTIHDVWIKRKKLIDYRILLKFKYHASRFFIKDKISSVDVSSRWKRFQNDDEYLEILQDEELLRLSENLFEDTAEQCSFVRTLMLR